MDSSQPIYSVGEITRQIKIILEEGFPSLWVEGEISNYKKHYSGHYYFTLKDSESQISCVMWRSRTHSVPFQIEDGMKVQIFGNLRLYEKSGRYQIDSILIQQAGIGDLQMKLEALKQKLFDEGLFDDEYKKLIPKIPHCIGVITSPTGAAIKDIISVLHRRFPAVEIFVYGVKVQGDGAKTEIVNAIEELNSIEGIDVIIIGRGGGSLEDLWAFNEEDVARAIFASNIPVISAVGHEIDFTISDMVADLRAPTPSVAAEIAVPNADEIRQSINGYKKYLQSVISEDIVNFKEKISSLLNNYYFKKPEDTILQYFQKIADLTGNLNLFHHNNLMKKKDKVLHLNNRLVTLDPKNVLRRGYAMIYKNEKSINSVNQMEVNDSVLIKMKDGSLESIIKKLNYE